MLKEIIDQRTKEKYKIKNPEHKEKIVRIISIGFIIGVLLFFIGWVLGG